LHQNLKRRLLETCAFINAWSWRHNPSYRVDGCLSFLGSVEKIVLLMQILHWIRCIASFNLANYPMPIFLPSHAFLGNPMQHICP
jgi:hypothetical protein